MGGGQILPRRTLCNAYFAGRWSQPEYAATETGDGPTGDGDGGFNFNVDLLN